MTVPLRMNRRDRKLWRSARTVADLGQLMARWLEGDIDSWPGYQPGYGPDDETTKLIPVLATLNRAGFLTVGSQPGETGPGADGAHWEQAAAVEGFITDRNLYGRLLAAAQCNGITAVVCDHQARHYDDPVVATTRDGRPHTTFGGPLGYRDIRGMWPGLHQKALTDLGGSVRVAFIAPEYGTAGRRIWAPLLAEAKRPLA